MFPVCFFVFCFANIRGQQPCDRNIEAAERACGIDHGTSQPEIRNRYLVWVFILFLYKFWVSLPISSLNVCMIRMVLFFIF